MDSRQCHIFCVLREPSYPYLGFFRNRVHGLYHFLEGLGAAEGSL